MPTTLELGDNRATTPIPPAPEGSGGWRAFAIHPESLVDTVIVDGQRLGPGSLVYTGGQPRLELVRGVTTGGLTTPAVGGEVNNRLTLIAWTQCEQPTPPGPRAPFIDGTKFDASAASLPVGAWKRAMRLPFYGRRHGTFLLTCSGGTFNVRVRGVKYLPRRLSMSQDPFILSVEPLSDETATVVYNGGVALPTNGDPAGLTLHFGGTDSAEVYDEVQLWIQPTVFAPADASGHLYVTAEAFGDRAP